MNEDSNEVIVNEEIKNVSSEDFVREVVEASKEKPIVVDFWAPWCSPCKQLAPILEREVLNANGKISLVKVNIDESQSIAAQLQIQSIPTVYVFYQGQVVDGFQGNIQESEIKSFISNDFASTGTQLFFAPFFGLYFKIIFSIKSISFLSNQLSFILIPLDCTSFIN